MKIIHIPATPVDDSVVDHPAVVQERIIRDGNRWRMVVELTWDVLPEDIQVRYEGDADVDFANRAMSRIRGALNSLAGKGKTFAHYHILKTAHRCTELD